jgi:hypothetical protein
MNSMSPAAVTPVEHRCDAPFNYNIAIKHLKFRNGIS